MGRHFPQFELLELLGQGGMGIVYRAKQRSLDRVVALKVMPPEAAMEAGFSERFTREARTLARLQHPNIVGVHDFGVSDGLYYLVMEFVDGANLREAMRAGKLTPVQALAIVPQVCDALQYAHDQGVVHRDIKPENILLDRAGRVRIADFGLAKIVQRNPVDVTLTRAGQVMGTLHYMAPEQYRTPDAVDHRADIYSLGVVFYEMLTGELPLGSFPPPSGKPGVDARLDGVVMRALERERDRRWQQASDVKTQVSAISAAAGEAPGAAGPGVKPAGPASPATKSATATVHAGADGPAAGPGGKPARLSRMALVGGLGPALSLLLGWLAWAVTGAFTSGGTEDLLCATVGFTVSTATLLTGWILSMVAWGRIKHSGGALHGLPWAVTGTFLAPLFFCCGLPASMVLTPDIRVQEGPDGRTVRMPFLSVEEKDGQTRVRMPFLDVTTDESGRRVVSDLDEGDRADRVHRGPPGMTDFQRRLLATEIEALWTDAVASLSFDPKPEDRERLMTDGDRLRWSGLPEEERTALRETRMAGLPFADPRADLGAPHGEFRLVAVDLEPDGLSARVVRSNGRTTISFPIRRDGAHWRYALGRFERQDRAPVEGDRDGTLEAVETAAPAPVGGNSPPSAEGGKAPPPAVGGTSPGLPAPGLTGGPAPIGLSAERRDALFAELDALWKSQGKAFLRVTLRQGDGSRAPGFRLFHVILEGDPSRSNCEGIMIRTDGRDTLIAGFRGRSGHWAMNTGDRKGSQFRAGPATEADRDGDLFR
jgi:predicted Ser/Thr protein kinase